MINKLAIITINYNDAQGLKKTMNSVLNQSFKNFQYIVVDGNSKDESVSVIKNYSVSNLTWVSEPDSGIYNAMNKGIKLAKAEYLLFLNSGDYLVNENILERAIPSLESKESFIGFNLYFETKQREEKSHPEKITFSHLISKSLYHPSTFIKKEMFDIYGLYNEENKIVSDWEFFLKTIGLNGETFKSVNLGLTVFDMNGISSVPDNYLKVEKEREKVLKKHLGTMFNSDLDIFLFNQFKAPSKRIKYLKKIESSIFLRKLTTVILSFISIFTKRT